MDTSQYITYYLILKRFLVYSESECMSKYHRCEITTATNPGNQCKKLCNFKATQDMTVKKTFSQCICTKSQQAINVHM